jgi:hypothetical protein
MACRQSCTAAEFEDLVQRNMAANCGLDFREFVTLLRCIVMRDLEALDNADGDQWPHVFNLQRASFALEDLRGRLAVSMADPMAEPRQKRDKPVGISLAEPWQQAGGVPAERGDACGSCDGPDGDNYATGIAGTTPEDGETHVLMSSVDDLLRLVRKAVAEHLTMRAENCKD